MSSSIQYILIALIFAQNVLSKKEIYAIFDRVELCGNPLSNPKIKWENFTLSMKNGTSMFSSDAEIFGDPISPVEIRINCQRCASREALDTCEDYHTLVTSNGCELLSVKHMIWTPFVDAFHPKFHCPIRSGKYKQIKGWFDVKMFQMFPIEPYYWKLMYTLTSRQIPLSSFCIDARIQRRHI